ncbi:hypothetical protein NDU88_003954 [Pleurodeles waltl]|uniref:Uncharacterized protein n=1 Tax=Pleurodeles waltl TaxID=8319 RepID=A0AAV7T6C0_PLEWA|nr:hypothetical protein NDU88_003954 [Pleurodeles waltl]
MPQELRPFPGQRSACRSSFSTSAASSSKRSAICSLVAPRGRHAVSLQRAEPFSGRRTPRDGRAASLRRAERRIRASGPHVTDALLRSREQSVLSYQQSLPHVAVHQGGARPGFQLQLLRQPRGHA